jgi:bacterioferritin (cytochrome b1)
MSPKRSERSAALAPTAISWLQRGLRHEFAAARQFTLQAVVARRLGDTALAAECEQSAADEIIHAQRLAALLDAHGIPFGEALMPVFPVGRTVREIVDCAYETELLAVRLYRDAARANGANEPARQLFERLCEEETVHLAALAQRMRDADRPALGQRGTNATATGVSSA